MVEGLRKRLADKGLSLELTDAAKDLIIARGYDPLYGARPLRRAACSPAPRRSSPRSCSPATLNANSTLVLDARDGELCCDVK